MTGPTHAYNASSDTGITLHVFEYFDLVVDNYKDIVEEIFTDALTDHRDDFRDHASRNEGWADIHTSLDVFFSGNHIKYTVDDPSFADREYGTIQQAPRPLVRSFAAKNADPLAQRIEDRLAEVFG